MDRIAQEKSFRQAVFKYHVNLQFIYRMRWRYDGRAESLMPGSRRPHSYPNQYSDEEIALIKKMHAKFINDGLNTLWYRLNSERYSRSMPALFRVMRRLGLYRYKPKNPKYVPKPYKVVPNSCIVGHAKELGQKFYQYTAIYESCNG